MDYSKLIYQIEEKIKLEEKKGSNIEYLLEQELELFLKARKELLDVVKAKNIDYNLTIATAEIAQLKAIIILLKKLNKPHTSYERRITEIENYFVGDNVTVDDISE